jgi:hypothetical protein
LLIQSPAAAVLLHTLLLALLCLRLRLLLLLLLLVRGHGGRAGMKQIDVVTE